MKNIEYNLFILDSSNSLWKNYGISFGALFNINYEDIFVSVDKKLDTDLVIGDKYNVLLNNSFSDCIYKNLIYAGEEDAFDQYGIVMDDIKMLKFAVQN